MTQAPKNRNFLGKVTTFGWSHKLCGYVQTGNKWTECFWYSGDFFLGSLAILSGAVKKAP